MTESRKIPEEERLRLDSVSLGRREKNDLPRFEENATRDRDESTAGSSLIEAIAWRRAIGFAHSLLCLDASRFSS